MYTSVCPINLRAMLSSLSHIVVLIVVVLAIVPILVVRLMALLKLVNLALAIPLIGMVVLFFILPAIVVAGVP
ncbi:hypothetical protein MKX07_000300 [Trichoderma sp. CBMAI-0711]|nr:hypothetical protein MKX07_000300 [Trichoderma sp. CBMAI-0711]